MRIENYVIVARHSSAFGQSERVERHVRARLEEERQKHVAMNHVSDAS